MFDQAIPLILTAAISGVTGIVSWYAADRRRSAIEAKSAESNAKKSEAEAISVEIQNANNINSMYRELLDTYKLEFAEVKRELEIVRTDLAGYRNEVLNLRNHIINVENENERLRKEVLTVKTIVSNT